MAIFSVRMDESVAVVTIENPPANALSQGAVAELGTVADQISRESSSKVVVITGAGRFFIAGADIQELSGMDLTSGHKASQAGQRILNSIEMMDKPWIAAINGACLGGGMELALACHIRVAGEGAKLGLPEVNLGIIPGFGGTQRLPRLVGPGKSFEMILTGGMVTGKEAKEMGLVERVVPDGEVLSDAMALAKKIAAHGTPAIRAAVQSIRRGRRPLEEGLVFEAERFGKLCNTFDMHEGMTAFLEKREPKFEDR